MISTSVRLGLAMFVIAVAQLLVANEAVAATIKMEASLTPTAASRLASGKAKFEQRATRSKFSTQGEDLGASFNGKTATVSVNGVVVGTARVALGGFDLNLDTIRRQTVPAIKKGDKVSVSIDGVNVLNGTF